MLEGRHPCTQEVYNDTPKLNAKSTSIKQIMQSKIMPGLNFKIQFLALA